MPANKKTTLILAGSFLVFLVLSLIAQFAGETLIASSVNLFGSIASVFGLIFVFVQLASVKSAAQAAQAATVEAHERVHAFMCAMDIAKAKKTVQEAQNFCRQNKYEIAIIRMQDIKQSINTALVNPGIRPHIKLNTFNGYIRDLSIAIGSLEKELANPATTFDASTLNATLEEVLNGLMALETKVKQLGDNHV